MLVTKKNWQRIPRLPIITKKMWHKATIGEEQAPGIKECVYVDIGAEGAGKNATWGFSGVLSLHNGDIFIAGEFYFLGAKSELDAINTVLDNVSDWYSRLL